jgi:galactose mutarotase
MTLALVKSMTQTPAKDGAKANVVELTNRRGCSIVVMDIGATWLSCELVLKGGARREVLLGVATMAQFETQSAYMGVSVGRYANRIHHGRFSIGEEVYQLSMNHSKNCLHGGEVGFDKRRWTIVDCSQNSVLMTLRSPDGDQGFPGNLLASVRYTLTHDDQVEIVYQAECDQPCPVNLTNHAYFNLQGSHSNTSALKHTLQINADAFLPIDEVGIPLGAAKSVVDTGFDFRLEKQVLTDFMQDEQQQIANGYDHAYILVEPPKLNQAVATLTSPDQQVAMKVFTNKPALQLYTGNFLSGTPKREGGVYSNYAGIALETQFLPDAPNHPEWNQVSSILNPGEMYCYSTTYQFEV